MLAHPNFMIGTQALRVTLKDQQDETEPFLNVSQATLSSKGGGPLLFSAEGSFKERPFTIASSAGALSQLIKDNQPWPLAIVVNFPQLSIDLKGHLLFPINSENFTFQLAVKGDTSHDLSFIPKMRLSYLGPFTFTGQLTQIKDGYRLTELKGQWGPNDLAGHATFMTNGPRPKVVASLSSESNEIDFLTKELTPAGWDTPGRPAARHPSRGHRTVRRQRTGHVWTSISHLPDGTPFEGSALFSILAAMVSSSSRTRAAATAAVLLVAVAGCAPQEVTPTPDAVPTAATCAKDSLKTRTPGKLTIATDEPAYEPWFKDNKPDNGEGFEAAVAYAVAEKLGYAPGGRHLDPGQVQQRHRPRAEDLRLRHQPVLHHRRAQAGGRLLRAVLPGAADGHRAQVSKIAGQDVAGRPQGRQARRPGRHHQLPGDHRR